MERVLLFFPVGRVTSTWKLRCCNESQDSRLFAEGCAADQGLKLSLFLTVALFYLFVCSDWVLDMFRLKSSYIREINISLN